MYKTAGLLTLGLFAMSASGWAQAQPPSPPSVNQQLSLEFLATVLRSASTFHDMVKSMNIQGSLNPTPAVNPDGTPGIVRPMSRTAAMLGAGAGAGAAIGELSGNQKGLMIGIIAGTAGALVLDQVLRHREEKPQDPAAAPRRDTDRKLLERPAPAPQVQQ